MNQIIDRIGIEGALGIGVGLVLMALFFVGAIVGRWRRRAQNIRRFGVPDPTEPGLLLRAADPRADDTMDSRFDQMITQSGIGISSSAAFAFVLFVGLGAAIATYLFREDFWSPALALAIGVAIPMAGFAIAHSIYRRKMREQLPDLLYLLSRSVRAGLSLPQAIEYVGERGAKPMADEFRLVAQQIRLGLTPPAALRLAANRIRMTDFDALVGVATVYTSAGGNLPLMTERLAASARDHNQFRGYFRSATSQARITAVIIGLFSPVLLLYYVIQKPEYVQAFFNDARAVPLLIVGALIQLLGVYWLYRILKIDY